MEIFLIMIAPTYDMVSTSKSTPVIYLESLNNRKAICIVIARICSLICIKQGASVNMEMDNIKHKVYILEDMEPLGKSAGCVILLLYIHIHK